MDKGEKLYCPAGHQIGAVTDIVTRTQHQKRKVTIIVIQIQHQKRIVTIAAMNAELTIICDKCGRGTLVKIHNGKITQKVLTKISDMLYDK